VILINSYIVRANKHLNVHNVMIRNIQKLTNIVGKENVANYKMNFKKQN